MFPQKFGFMYLFNLSFPLESLLDPGYYRYVRIVFRLTAFIHIKCDILIIMVIFHTLLNIHVPSDTQLYFSSLKVKLIKNKY